MKEKLESQIQILAEQIHTAEMTDEHLQSRLDAIAREQKEKEEAKASYEKEKHSGDEQLAQVRKRQEEAAQTLAAVSYTHLLETEHLSVLY